MLLEKLEAIKLRYEDVEQQLSDPGVVSDMKKFTKLNKEYKDLGIIVTAYNEYKLTISNIAANKEILNTDDDPEMKEMAKMELDELEPQKEKMEEDIKILLIPKDPNDSKDVIFEIRSGTGGDEASIFAGDLYRMYSKFFESQSWKVETITVNEGSVGGFNKIAMEVRGENVFGKLKFESGAHRVQRVPKTESQGRVHTSAATVVVMPKRDMEDVDINKADLERQTFRSSGAGGQHVNKTESGVRYIHIPTGIAAESTDGRSQHSNSDIALQRLYQKIFEVRKQKYESEQRQNRQSLVGSGDRSDKVRTYNYPQNRVTDHRINLTLYSLDKIMEGSIADIIEALQVAENAQKLQEGTTA